MKKLILLIIILFNSHQLFPQCSGRIDLTLENQMLHIHHDSAYMNCILDMEFNIVVKNDTVNVYELNNNPSYDCGLMYIDFDIMVVFVDTGNYVLNVFMRWDNDMNNDTILCTQTFLNIIPDTAYDALLIAKPNAADTHTVNILEKPFDETFYISQNAPNPFSGTTRIDLFVPHSIKESYLYFYDLQGRQINRVQLRERGNFSIQVIDVLLPGTYFYSLVNDNQRIGTKKMILIEK